MTLSATVIGDLMLDEITWLAEPDLNTVIQLKALQTPIRTRPGGTVLPFARSACEIGFESVFAIGKVGAMPSAPSQADVAGEMLLSELVNVGATPLIALDPYNDTGRVILVYLMNDQRLMLVDPGANASFSRKDITLAMEMAVTESDLLFVSGYGLLTEERREAVMYLVGLAHENGRLVILDVVPHSIYTQFDFDTLVSCTRNINGLILEVNTARRLLGRDNVNQIPSVSEIDGIAEVLLHLYDLVVLRPDSGSQYIYDRRGTRDYEATGYWQASSEARHGYSERASALLLFRYLTQHLRAASF